MATFAIHQYVASVFETVARTNRYFATREPCKKANSDPGEMRVVLYTTLEVLRIVAILFQPVMPASMNKLLDLLAVPPDERNFRDLEVWTEDIEVDEPFWRIRARHRLKPGALAVLREYGVQSCLLRRDEPLVTVLAALPDWQQVYSDDLSVLFVRRAQAGILNASLGHPLQNREE